jgi:hypothetical protein
MISVVLFLYIATEAYSVTAILKFDLNDFNVCNKLPVLVFQVDESLVIMFFFILAYFISQRIEEQMELNKELKLSLRNIQQVKARR